MNPNIVIVMCDQLRADLRKGRGYPLDTMPFLDEFDRTWCGFENAYTSNPTCMPARVSMLTGRYASCHNVRTNHNVHDAVYSKDMIDVLKEKGYATALCGKNHSHLTKDDVDFWEECFHLGAIEGMKVNEDEASLDRFLKTLHFCDSDVPSPYTVKEQLPYRNVSSFFSFIDSLEKEKPFFSWVSFAEPHNPYQVPSPYFDMFPPEILPEIKTDLSGKGEKFHFMRKMWEKVYGADIERRILRDRSNYLGMLRLIDDQFRRLYEGLEERGLIGHTVIFFISDHGDFAGEYGLIRKGPDLSEPLVRIPFAVGGGPIKIRGIDRKTMVSITDIFPTVCALTGAETPFGVQGRNLLPVLEGRPYPEKDFAAAYAECGFGGLYWNENDVLDPEAEGAATDDWQAFDCLNTWTQAGCVRMVRKGRFRIIGDMMGNFRLYDVVSDPEECTDLSENAEYSAVLTDMVKELASAMMRASDPIPSPSRRYRVKQHPDGYFFDESFRVEKDPGVKYFPVKRRGDVNG
ncbi:MAG: sulfatase-like hydrolase/transferase [Bullifex sp.]